MLAGAALVAPASEHADRKRQRSRQQAPAQREKNAGPKKSIETVLTTRRVY
jgi:hypothetical protein